MSGCSVNVVRENASTIGKRKGRGFAVVRNEMWVFCCVSAAVASASGIFFGNKQEACLVDGAHIQIAPIVSDGFWTNYCWNVSMETGVHWCWEFKGSMQKSEEMMMERGDN